MVHQEQIHFDTTGHRHMADLTDQVAAIVERPASRPASCRSSASAARRRSAPSSSSRDLSATCPNARPPDPAQPRLRPRAGLARRQRPFALAGHALGAVALGARGRWQAGAGHLAADHPPGVRRPPATAHRGGDGHGGVASWPSLAHVADRSSMPRCSSSATGSADNFLPFFSCQAVGDVPLEAAQVPRTARSSSSAATPTVGVRSG